MLRIQFDLYLLICAVLLNVKSYLVKQKQLQIEKSLRVKPNQKSLRVKQKEMSQKG
jgi:hypothetical protein